MTLLGVAGRTALMLAGFGLRDSITPDRARADGGAEDLR
jgi:hypothetical protein